MDLPTWSRPRTRTCCGSPHRTVEDSARAWLCRASASWWSRAAPWTRGHSAAARGHGVFVPAARVTVAGTPWSGGFVHGRAASGLADRDRPAASGRPRSSSSVWTR
ncbi:hypothetical protein QJS66_10595 [Kocuria rhizophila]|nr:hypothetical protein QJS66_10595 [Kocuria rhizophila]